MNPNGRNRSGMKYTLINLKANNIANSVFCVLFWGFIWGGGGNKIKIMIRTIHLKIYVQFVCNWKDKSNYIVIRW